MTDTTTPAELALQTRFEHTRDLKLRQWYTETQSPDPQIQFNAQCRLQLQLQLRLQRADERKFKKQRDAHKAASDTAQFETARKMLRKSKIAAAMTMRSLRGEMELSEKSKRKMVRRWGREGKTLEEVLGGMEWDRRSDFGIFKRDVYDESVQGVEKKGEEKVKEEEERIVSDDEEVGGVLIGDVWEEGQGEEEGERVRAWREEIFGILPVRRY